MNIKVVLFNIADVIEKNAQPALGLGYIKSYVLKEHKENVQVKIFRTNILDNILREKPDLIGISSVTQYYTKAIELATEIKKNYKNIIIIGGVHISTLPESYNEIFDCGVIREGEITVSEIISLLMKDEFNKEKLQQVEGLVFKKNGQLIITKNRQLIQNLDDIPNIDRNDYNFDNYAHIITSRGCPYACAFCSSTHFWGTRSVRYHSAQYVYDDIKNLVENYSIKHITIWDDLFVFNIPRLKQIIYLIKNDSNINGKITFSCNARANIVNDSLCEMLKELNVKYIYLGLESGSDRILKKIKGSVSLDQNKNAVTVLHKLGFIVKGSFVINNPDENIDDLKLTYQFIKESQLDGGGINIAIPLPGTPYWNYSVNENLVSNNMDFGLLNIKSDFTKLNDGDFIKLSKNLTYTDILYYGKKIQEDLINKEIRSIKKSLGLNEIIIILKNPRLYFVYIYNTIHSYLSLSLKNEINVKDLKFYK